MQGQAYGHLEPEPGRFGLHCVLFEETPAWRLSVDVRPRA